MRRSIWANIVTHLLGVGLAVLLGALYQANQLGPDRVGAVVRGAGRVAMGFLVVSLVPSAVAQLTDWRGLMGARRWLGLYAAAYALAHLGLLAVLDYGLELRLLWRAVVEGPALILGLGALALLSPLAATSTAGWQRRLGTWWKRLHRLAYAAALLASLHYAAVFKELRPWPFLTIVSVLALLGVRVDAWLRARARSMWTPDGRAASGAEAQRRSASDAVSATKLPSGKLVSPRYEHTRLWWAFVSSLILLSAVLYLLSLQTWVYWALLLIAVLIGWWTRQ